MYQDSKYINSLNDNIVIWKYIDFPSFVYLLQNDKLIFRRVDCLKDANECNHPLVAEISVNQQNEPFKIHFDTTYFSSKNEIPGPLHGKKVNRKRTFCNCWSIDTNENYALWKIYLKNQNEGVAIKTNIKYLKESFNKTKSDIYIGKIDYEKGKYSKINEFNIALRKDSPYKYENEVRALILYEYIQEFTITEIDIDLNILIQEIYVSPFAGDWFKYTVDKLINTNFKDKFKKSIPICQSKINENK